MASLQPPQSTPSLLCPEASQLAKCELSRVKSRGSPVACLSRPSKLVHASVHLEATVLWYYCARNISLLPCSPTPPDQFLCLPVYAICPPLAGLFSPSNIRVAVTSRNLFLESYPGDLNLSLSPSSPSPRKRPCLRSPIFIVDIQTPQQATAGVNGLMKQHSFPTGLRTT